ncbi:hypothetical protein VYU27_000011 [Nannochloropsis oceanica]
MIRAATSSLDPPAALLSLGTNDLVIDAPVASASATPLKQEELTLSNLGQVRCHPDQYIWNLRLPSADEMQRELEAALAVPGLTAQNSTMLILHTATATSRDYTPLRSLARKLEPKNLLIVTGALPGPISLDAKPERVSKDLVHTLRFGIPLVPPAATRETDAVTEKEEAVENPALLSTSERIGAGFIGLVDLNGLNKIWPEKEREGREDLLLQSLAYASRESSGAPIFITTQDAFGRAPFDGKRIYAVFSTLIKYGADKTRIVFCRCPCRLDLEDAYNALLTDGVHVSFSFHGNAFYPLSPPVQKCAESTLGFKTVDSPSDEEGACLLSRLCRKGFSSQLHLSHSIDCRIKLQKYGGFGYTHLFLNVSPRFERLEVSRCDVERMNGANLRDLLAWWTPPPKQEKEVEMGTCSWCHKEFEMQENMYFTKFSYVYCRSKCLSKHGDTGWTPIQT